MRTVLVSGGAGYVGSHAVDWLLHRGYDVVVIDDLSVGHREALPPGVLLEGDIGDGAIVGRIVRERRIDGVLHFAASCSVGESVTDPRKYVEQNVLKAAQFVHALLDGGVRHFVFSSTCATYGVPLQATISEDHPQNPINPYGETKLFIERMLRHYDRAYGFRSVLLRYFNAAGAAESGQLGESHDPETHLIPLALKTARGQREAVAVYGSDYPTNDGTCIRDYVHVTDLAEAHLLALERLWNGGASDAFNLGTGRGYSVREIIRGAERVTGRTIATRMESRRPGDPPVLVADASRAMNLLGWSPRRSGIETILETAWRWHQNPKY